ncbi:MAG TPA: class I adenylate-forming enzyme family protein [Acidimicrobiales bacterium]
MTAAAEVEAPPVTVPEMALRRARSDATAPFLVTVDEHEPYTTHALSYGQVLSRAAALAGALRDAGVGPGDRVGCYLTNEPCWVVASLGVWFAGGAVAAVGTLLPANEADRLFDLAEVDVVVRRQGAPSLGGDVRVIEVDGSGVLVGAADPGADGWTTAVLPTPDPDDLAVAIFTSGTTGRPKGIPHTHADLIAEGSGIAAGYARSGSYRPDPAPAHLPPGVIFNPFGHMTGFVRVAFRLWIGRPTLLVPRFTVPAVRALLSNYPMDSLQLTPAMIHALADTDEVLDLSSVTFATSGTAPLATAVRERFEARYGIPVMQAYGNTEVGAVAQERLDDVRAGLRGPGSVGRLAAGVEVRIRHLDDDRPEGEGEIMVRTDGASTEFIGGEAVPVDADGFVATGDVGRIDEHGILYITGRVQEKMIVGGFNVYPAEVEEVARASSLVNDVVVVALPDERLGELPVAGVAWVGEPDEQALVDEMRGQLAAYKVPRRFFAIDAVPLTPRDKVDRRRAGELARDAFGLADPKGDIGEGS